MVLIKWVWIPSKKLYNVIQGYGFGVWIFIQGVWIPGKSLYHVIQGYGFGVSISLCGYGFQCKRDAILSDGMVRGPVSKFLRTL